MFLKLKWQTQGPRSKKKFKANSKNKNKVLNNIDLVHVVAWPKEEHTETAAVSQLLQPSKDQKSLPLGEEQAGEMSS